MWLWKYEPVSPSGTPPLEVDDDNWLLFDDKSIDLFKNAADYVMYDDHHSSLSSGQRATKLLEKLDEWIKEGNCFIFIFYVLLINILID